MLEKGQLTVEFIFVIVYFVMLITIMFTISDNFVDSQAEIHILNQETKIANSLSKILTASMAYSDADSYEIKYRIPRIYILGKEAPMPCDITVGGVAITVSVEYEGSTIEETIPYNGPALGDTRCGELITIS